MIIAMNMRYVYFLICISKSIELLQAVSRNSVSKASDAGNERLAEYEPDISPDEALVARELFDRRGRNRSPNSVSTLKPTRFLQTRKSRQKRSSEAPDFLNSLNNGLSKGREINGPSRTKFRRDSKQNGSNFKDRFLNRVYGNDSYHDDLNYGAKSTALPKVDYRSWKKDIKRRASQVQHLWEQLFHQQQDQQESRVGLQFSKSAHSGLLNVSAQQTSPTENFNLDNDGLFSEYHPDLEDRGRYHKKHKKFIKYHRDKSRRNFNTTKELKKKRRKGYKRMRVGKNSSTKFASLKKAEVDLKRVINNHHRKRTGESILNLGHRFNEFGQSGNGERGSRRRGKFKSGFKNPNQKHVRKGSVDRQFQDSDSNFLLKNNREEMGKDFHAKIEKEEKPDMWGKPDRDKTVRGKDKNMFGSPNTRDNDPEIQEDQSRTRMTREEYLDFWNNYRRQKGMLEADPRAIQFRSELHKSREEKKNEEGIMGTLRRVARSIFSPAESILGSYISVLNKTRNWLTNTDPDKVTYVKHVIPYDLLYKQYNLYYNCLRVKKQYHIDNLGLPMNNIEALLVQSLDKLTLECHTCLPPYAEARPYGVRWLRRLLIGEGGFEDIPNDEESYALNVDGDLMMHGIVSDSAGMYTCFKNSAHEVTYLIGVENLESRIQVYESGNPGARPSVPKLLQANNLLLYSQWSEWSDCNRCDNVGQRKKIGLCMVKKYDQKNKVMPTDARVFTSYPDGLPCRSPLVPLFVGEIPDVKSRQTEVMIGFCNVICTTIPPLNTITDSNGEVVEIVQTGKGRYSMREAPPTVPPDVKRKTVFAAYNSRLILDCPHANANKWPVRWQNGTQILEEYRLNELTKGRIYIDFYNTLIIKSVRFWDEATYSCWINLLMIGTIKVKVEGAKSATESFFNTLSYMGLGSTIFIIVFTVVRICMLQNEMASSMR